MRTRHQSLRERESDRPRKDRKVLVADDLGGGLFRRRVVNLIVNSAHSSRWLSSERVDPHEVSAFWTATTALKVLPRFFLALGVVVSWWQSKRGGCISTDVILPSSIRENANIDASITRVDCYESMGKTKVPLPRFRSCSERVDRLSSTSFLSA